LEPIEFDNKDKRFPIICDLSLGYTIVFEFTDLSLITLIDLISILPKMENEKRRKNIKLGHCIEQIRFDMIIELCNISFQRVNLEFSDTQMLKRMVEKDAQLMIDMTKSAEHLDRRNSRDSQVFQMIKEKRVIVTMVQKRYHAIVKILLSLNAKFLVET